ncbi:MAG: twitching motility protein PilT [Acidimicrobiaceae bacterium]|jgi:twitching motility protein PilT|nr:twitching motility protein PilT [Acidimicrobiaceae bacterium]
MQSASRRVGEFLVARKVLSRDSLEVALRHEEESGVPLAKILAGEGLVSERDLVAAVADQIGIGFWDFDQEGISPNVDGLLPETLARRLCAVAVMVDNQHLVVAMDDPTDEGAVAEISEATGFPIEPMLAVRSDLRAVLGAMYPDRSGRGRAEDEPAVEELHVNTLLAQVVELRGSDLHLAVGLPPCARVDGSLLPLEGYHPLNGSEIRRMVFAILTQRQRERFESDLELDTSHSIPGLGRFRVNVFLQRDSVGAVMRVIPNQVVPFESLGLPGSVAQFAELPRGLVLVTGPTGSGKSTTLASMVDIINNRKPLHIMTVEDPIEFLHQHKRAIVNQREIGEDTQSFAQALKHVLRQDPDVILVGEMRDLETISTALTAAETGHLVFATLHTQDAPQSIDRVIDVFPPHQQQQIRVQLASAIQGIVCQQLLPKAGSLGRAVAVEVLVATPGVRNLIREGKTHQIYSAMQAGAQHGMQTMDQSLAGLVRAGKVAMGTALERSANEDDLRRLVAG